MYVVHTYDSENLGAKPWWHNYWQHLWTTKLASPYDNLRNGCLKQYNCTFLDILPEGKGFVLEFDTEEDALAFILKWG
jgi:hypothetical protein